MIVIARGRERPSPPETARAAATAPPGGAARPPSPPSRGGCDGRRQPLRAVEGRGQGRQRPDLVPEPGLPHFLGEKRQDRRSRKVALDLYFKFEFCGGNRWGRGSAGNLE